jgi:hypothetical protein
VKRNLEIDDLEDLRSNQASKEWRLLKYDARRNIKSYDKRDDQNSGVRSFKLDVIVNGSLETVVTYLF